MQLLLPPKVKCFRSAKEERWSRSGLVGRRLWSTLTLDCWAAKRCFSCFSKNRQSNWNDFGKRFERNLRLGASLAFFVELIHSSNKLFIRTVISARQFEVDGKAIALLSRGKCLRLLWIRCVGCGVVCAGLFAAPAKKWIRRSGFHRIFRKRAIATKRWRWEIRVAHSLFDFSDGWKKQSIHYRRKPCSVGKFDSQTKLDGLLLGTIHDRRVISNDRAPCVLIL